MFQNSKLNVLKDALHTAEDLRKISSINIANSSTIGYKALKGIVAPDCECQCFEDLLPEVAQQMSAAYNRPGSKPGAMHLEIVKDNTPGRKTKVNGKIYEGSNVDATSEFANIVTAGTMTKNTIAAIQLDNKIQQEILNITGR